MVKNSINAISAETFCPKIMLKIILLLNLEIASAQEWDFTQAVLNSGGTAQLRTLEGTLVRTDCLNFDVSPCIQIRKQTSIGGRRNWEYIFVGFLFPFEIAQNFLVK